METKERTAAAVLARAEARWPSRSYNAAPRTDDFYCGMVSLNLPWLNPVRSARERAASTRRATRARTSAGLSLSAAFDYPGTDLSRWEPPRR